MSTDQNAPAEQPGSAVPPQAVPPQEPAWGAEQPQGSKVSWSGRKTIAAVAIAVGIAAAGGTAIYAANGAVGATEMGPGGRGGPGGYGRMGGPGMGGLSGGPGFGTALHGEFQVGTVTEVSSTSIGVKSTDGYTKTYTIDSNTVVGGGGGPNQQTKGDLSSIANGDTVTVIGETTDGKTTAKSIVERVLVRNGQQLDGQPQGVPPRREDQGSGQPPTS
ncbi:hypothetical protein ACFFQW_09330 [Umezawaea endophytica]|uniref:hypothetical protein n=1 Tax=Umezawaea endophytica TaxID=1654476 RepID=UPI0023DEF750|nr:hypothetical protein [Umezawaea endophytica]